MEPSTSANSNVTVPVGEANADSPGTVGWLYVPYSSTYGFDVLDNVPTYQESIADGSSGLLVDDQAGFEAATRRLLSDRGLRERLGAGARERCDDFSWESAQASFAVVLVAAVEGRRVDTEDPEEGDLQRARLAQ